MNSPRPAFTTGAGKTSPLVGLLERAAGFIWVAVLGPFGTLKDSLPGPQRSGALVGCLEGNRRHRQIHSAANRCQTLLPSNHRTRRRASILWPRILSFAKNFRRRFDYSPVFDWTMRHRSGEFRYRIENANGRILRLGATTPSLKRMYRPTLTHATWSCRLAGKKVAWQKTVLGRGKNASRTTKNRVSN